jgi:hypothetical protein
MIESFYDVWYATWAQSIGEECRRPLPFYMVCYTNNK